MDKTPQEILTAVREEVEIRENRRAKDPEYAGLFRQQFDAVTARVEHVISELLQNADDAKATRVKIFLQDNAFVFQHNGVDFEESDFRAICSFSVSNKHTIQTTGFRGIGFKSTFSLGDIVQLITPHFQVRFHRERPTYPETIDERPDPDWNITVHVPLNPAARSEIQNSINLWQSAPCSMLFFQNLKEGITIQDAHFSVKSEGGIKHITENGRAIWEGRLISGNLIPLPSDAETEIAKLRGGTSQSETQAKVDILINKDEKGRIYSVLPASDKKRLDVPFAVNGPFVLGPDRDAIRSPSQSATNRFLFTETGRIVAKELLRELKHAGAFSEKLRQAYELLPLTGELNNPDAETEATRIVQNASLEILQEQDWVLTNERQAICPGKVNLVALPSELAEVWPPVTLRKIFCPDAHIIHPQIPKMVVTWLEEKGHLTQIVQEDVLHALIKEEIPRPENQEQLFKLWAWAARSIINKTYDVENQVRQWSALNILPAKGAQYMKALGNVYNFSNETEIEFKKRNLELNDFDLYQLDTGFISEDDLKQKSPPQTWWIMMDCKTVGLTRARTLRDLLIIVEKNLIDETKSSPSLTDALKKLWDIHQEFDIPINKELPIKRASGELVSIEKRQLLLSRDSLDITALLPADYLAEHLLAEEWYPSDSKGKANFCDWLIGQEHAFCFPHPLRHQSPPASRHKAIAFVKRYGSNIANARNGNYYYDDYFWPDSIVKHWALKATVTTTYYANIFELLVKHHSSFLKKHLHLIFSRGYGGYPSSVDVEPPIPCSWARFFSDKPCLVSQSGELRRPPELYLTNAATMPLIEAGVLTVDAQQQEDIGAELLAIIGCRTSLPRLTEITGIIKAALNTSNPSPERLCRLLVAADKPFRTTDEDSEKDELLKFLAERQSIPSASDKLELPDNLVLDAGDRTEIPVVASDLRGTAIIGALNIRHSPSRESDIAWIDSEIKVNTPLTQEQLRKLRKLLSQPSSVSEHLWNQGKWLALDGTVRVLDYFKFRHSDTEQLPVKCITDPTIRSQTADFSVIDPLPPEFQSFPKRKLLECLHSEIQPSGNCEKCNAEWLSAIAHVLWTEAEASGEDQDKLEETAKKWRNAHVVLYPNLSRHFLLNNQVIAEGIKVAACWTDKAHFAIRARDEDEICELTGEIAKHLKETIIATGTKTAAKLVSWIAQNPGRIERLGLKALNVDHLRAWPDNDAGNEDPSSDALGNRVKKPHVTTGNGTATSPVGQPHPNHGQAQTRMLSYVGHSIDRQKQERQRKEAQEAGAEAEEMVVSWERKAGRDAKRLGGNNPGYDIESKASDGSETRYIEVKSIAGTWGGEGVRLSSTQFEYAERQGNNYWLYVVENAKTNNPIIHRIQNPAAHISSFCFDCGWREIAETEGTGKPSSAFIPKIGDTVLFGDDEVVVENIEKQGAFVMITFQFNGRSYRKMNTSLSPKE